MEAISSPGPPKTAPEGRPRILVVEDEFLIRLLISDALRDAGFDVIEAFNGDEAIDILSTAPVDLVLSDVRMPGAIDGLELLRLVRETLPALPVILTSGHLAPDEALAKGATRFLAKPYLIDGAVTLVSTELKPSNDRYER
jgi:CheY-like chemotaxis protein